MLKLLLFPDAPGGAPPAVEPAGGSAGMADQIMADLNSAAASPSAAPTEAPPAAPAPATAPPAGGSPPAKPATPAKPAEAPQAKPAPPKPGAPAPAKPADKPLIWDSAPAQFREAHRKLQEVHDATKAELQTKITSANQRLEELSAREYLTPDQKATYQRQAEQLQQMQSELYSRDFQQSPEFKEKYAVKVQKIWTNVQAELKGLQVKDAAGNERPSTMADFQRVHGEQSSLTAQRRLAKEMFGEDSDVVLRFASELKQIEDAANDEIEGKRNGWAKERETSAATQQQQQIATQRVYTEFDAAVAQKFFQPIEGNGEYNKALDEGLKFVDGSSSAFSQKTPEAKAQTAALVRRLAAAYPAQAVLVQQSKARITELEALVAKLQGTDPGAGGEGGEGGGMPAAGGTDSLADEIGKLGR